VGVAWVFDGTCAGHNFWQALPLFCWRKFSLGCNFPFIGMAWGFAGDLLGVLVGPGVFRWEWYGSLADCQ